MAIKRTLQCEKCLCHKETSESKVRFASPRKWMLSFGIPAAILGIGAIIGALYLLNLPQDSGGLGRMFGIMIIVPASIFACLGVVFIILYIIKKSVAKRLFRCPKCGHRMVPVYHHHHV